MGLPAPSTAHGAFYGFRVYETTPRLGINPMVFESQIAPVTQGATYSARGLDYQTLIANPKAWYPARPINTIPGGAVMAQGNEVKWISQDAQVVKDLALRSGKILLALLEEMRLIKANYPVVQFLYDDGGQFIRDVLDGTHPVPSNVVIRHRYSDDWEAMEPYPLLDEALNVFSLSVNTAQPEDWPVYVAKLENDFAKREVGAGRVKTVP